MYLVISPWGYSQLSPYPSHKAISQKYLQDVRIKYYFSVLEIPWMCNKIILFQKRQIDAENLLSEPNLWILSPFLLDQRENSVWNCGTMCRVLYKFTGIVVCLENVESLLIFTAKSICVPSFVGLEWVRP